MVARDTPLFTKCACGTGGHQAGFTHTELREICYHTRGSTTAQGNTCPQFGGVLGKKEASLATGVRGSCACGGAKTKIEASRLQNIVICYCTMIYV